MYIHWICVLLLTRRGLDCCRAFHMPSDAVRLYGNGQRERQMEGGWGSDEEGHTCSHIHPHTLHLCLTLALHQFFPGTLVASSTHETRTPRPNTTYQVTIAQHSTWLLGQKCIQLFKASCQSVQSRRGLPHYSRKQLLRLMPHSWLSQRIKCPL